MAVLGRILSAGPRARVRYDGRAALAVTAPRRRRKRVRYWDDMKAGEVVELGTITGGRHPGRSDDAQIVVCDLTGVGVQDVAAAALVMERIGSPSE